MGRIHELAGTTLSSLPPRKGRSREVKQVDVVLIVSVLKLILLAYECWRLRPTSAVEQCRDPGLLARWKLRRIVRRALAESGGDLDSGEVYEAVLGLGRTVTAGDVAACVAELDAGNNELF